MKEIGYEVFGGCTALTEVYYVGTENDWAKIYNSGNNDPLYNATRYYYSETEPEVEGNFWHYVDGEIVVW